MARKKSRLHIFSSDSNGEERRFRFCPESALNSGQKGDVAALLVGCLPKADAVKGRKRPPDAARDSVSVRFRLGQGGPVIEVGYTLVSRSQLTEGNLDHLWTAIEEARQEALKKLRMKRAG